MSMAPKSMTLGRRGEWLAARYLEQNGYQILQTNYRNAHQEIDLICTDGEVLVFCEVKTRSCSAFSLNASRYGRPAGAITAEKKKNLLMAARAYLREHADISLRPRLDVIEVYVRQGTTGSEPSDILKIHHIRNAFGAS
jgi:putative endonuclease